MSMPDFTVERVADRVLRLSGELDGATAPILDLALSQALDRGGEVQVDLTELQFMDSSGISTLVLAARRLRGRGRLLLRRPDGIVRRALEICLPGEYDCLSIEWGEAGVEPGR